MRQVAEYRKEKVILWNCQAVPRGFLILIIKSGLATMLAGASDVLMFRHIFGVNSYQWSWVTCA